MMHGDGEPARRLLAIERPGKKIRDLSDAERTAFAQKLVDTALKALEPGRSGSAPAQEP
jgi:hypothetical protein